MLYRLAATLFFLSLATPLRAGELQTDSDWARVGAEAEQLSRPVVILVTSPDCGYCKGLRQEALRAGAIGTLLRTQAVTRELRRDTGGKMTDFDGERVRARVFFSRYDIFATPTLLILDPNGKRLAPALVGYNGAEPYAGLLGERLKQAEAVLAAHLKPARLAGGTGF